MKVLLEITKEPIGFIISLDKITPGTLEENELLAIIAYSIETVINNHANAFDVECSVIRKPKVGEIN